jgi:hypothetical protein
MTIPYHVQLTFMTNKKFCTEVCAKFAQSVHEFCDVSVTGVRKLHHGSSLPSLYLNNKHELSLILCWTC